ncbi:ribonuclease H-like domain-containing protein [Hysterangium stoloniferum]|nr:ribonuclease H-like domain-containing protein [Hysterangium stoloniferum]
MTPSSNWLALKKSLTSATDSNGRPKKRRKVADPGSVTSEGSVVLSTSAESSKVPVLEKGGNPDSVISLRRMIYGESTYPEAHLLPGKYISIDCEMVGIAGDSKKRSLAARDGEDESSLARVSVVNYYGAVLLDLFVRQRERVTDWRTAVSGVRESDMVNATSFSDVQKAVSDLLKDRILVGHAVHNDLQALLLSHPHNMIRDSQILAGKHGTISTQLPADPAGTPLAPIKRNKRAALRKLVSQELGVDIQSGEHSSVIDARATMALYRLHKKIWDKGYIPPTRVIRQKPSKSTVDDGSYHTADSTRKRTAKEVQDEDTAIGTSKGALMTTRRPKKQGISSGLSVVTKSRREGGESKRVVTGIRNKEKNISTTPAGTNWWATLGR